MIYLLNPGTRTEKEPVAIPYINLPITIAVIDCISVIPAPMTTKTLAISRQFFFPYWVYKDWNINLFTISPTPIAPHADPREHIDVISDDMYSIIIRV